MKKSVRKLYVFFAIIQIFLNLVSCNKNTFYSSKFGLVPTDDKDIKDKTEIPIFPVGQLPASAFLNMPPIGDQGQQGSCTGFAVGYAVMGYYINKKNSSNYNSYQDIGSPSYLYNILSKGNCTGQSFPQLLNLLISKGICSYSDMPYSDQECSTQPNADQNNIAAQNKIIDWKLVNKTQQNTIKSCIVAGYPLLIAVDIYEGMQSNPYWSSASGSYQGGHAMCLMGYDDSKQAFKVQNSWGANWGDNGYAWISYSFFEEAIIGREVYIIFP